MQFLQKFYQSLSFINKVLLGMFCIFLLAGLGWALLFSPPDYQQGNGVRIMYIHVPSAILSFLIYFMVSFFAFTGLIHWKWASFRPLSYVFIRALLPVGAFFTLTTLITGALWGKPMWGTWWVWDARLTSDLILLFIYIGAIGLINLSYDLRKTSVISSVFILVGLVDVPIIHYSVKWWATLHQGSGIVFKEATKGSIMADFMILPLGLMMVAFLCGFLLLFSLNTQKELLRKELRWDWDAVINFSHKSRQ